MIKRFEFKIDANDSRTEYVFMSKSPKMGSIKVLEGKAAKLFTENTAQLTKAKIKNNSLISLFRFD